LNRNKDSTVTWRLQSLTSSIKQAW